MIPRLIFLLAAVVSSGFAATVSALFARGYTVLPQPQVVEPGGADFRFGRDFRIETETRDAAFETLVEELALRFGLKPAAGSDRVIRLEIVRGSVAIGAAADRDRAVLAEQAYRLDLQPGEIRVTANAAPGLFYGVETLVQLFQRRDGDLWLPAARIVDWPDLQYRALYWDDAHHLERVSELKRAVRQAAWFKLNAFSIKLEGHFQYRSAPALTEPYALSPAEFQELTDYGLRYHVQVVPYLDAPAHLAFLLKHPEYARLRQYPQSNYELCVANPESYKLLFGMFQDLLDANRGVKYFYLSTDEPYYVGLADNPQCREAARAKELGSVGKLLAEFLDKAAGYLHDRGRTVIFWGEFPLQPGDIPSLPKHLVNGETYGPAFDPVFKANGIRSMIYSWTQGVQELFPEYYALPRTRRLQAGGRSPRVPELFELISFTPARQQADLMGMTNAGWADSGLHPETFWLGYASAGAYAWHPGSPSPQEATATFFALFYGPRVRELDRVYQLLSAQAQVWSDSWDTQPSTARKPIFGYSEGVYDKPRPAEDQTLPLPPLPSGENLSVKSSWAGENRRRLELAAAALAENDELLGRLYENLPLAQGNRYNLEVLLSIAQLCRQNLLMLEGLAAMDERLQSAARTSKPEEAVGAVDQALEIARKIKAARNRALSEAVEVWQKSWYPRVGEANGRRFFHELDDVKDHLPDRTVDMSFLVYRELLLPFGEWYDRVQAARNRYAQAHGLPPADTKLDWKATGAE